VAVILRTAAAGYPEPSETRALLLGDLAELQGLIAAGTPQPAGDPARYAEAAAERALRGRG